LGNVKAHRNFRSCSRKLSSDLRVAEQRIVKDTVSINVAAIPPQNFP